MSVWLNFFRSKLFYFKFIRVLLVLLLVILLCLIAYKKWLLPWVNRSLSENYFHYTGHHLKHDNIEIKLFACQINLNHIVDEKQLWQLDHLGLDLDCRQSLRERALVVREVVLAGLKASAHQQETGAWNFDEILTRVKSVAQKSESGKEVAKNPEEKAIKAIAPVLIQKISFINTSLDINSLALNKLPLSASPLNATVTNLDFRSLGPATIAVAGQINKILSLKISGSVNLESFDGSFEVTTNNIPLTWLEPQLKALLAFDDLGGVIDIHNKITLESAAPKTLLSSGQIANLKLRPTSMEQDALKWKSLEWENAEIDFAAQMVRVPLVKLNELDGQFIVTKDRKTNVQAMLISPSASTDHSVNKLEPAPQQSDKSVAATPWQFSIDKIIVKNAAVGFFDQSLVPSFSAIVQQFSGEIRHLASDEKVTTEIEMAGNVDGYAPVNLKGTAKLFSETPQLDALLSFKQMDMGAFSPYSAEYAGWRIKKGLLSVDLNYHYQDGKILGKNHVVIDNLEFGERVRGAQVRDIPVRLGLFMLTDEKGIAVLDAEITGYPNDPTFNFREIIWRALRNTFTKVVTAPFRFLSSLLKSDEDLGQVDFKEGESQLTEAAAKKIRLLGEALKMRPRVRMSVQGVYDQQRDLLALKEEQLKSKLQRSGVELESLRNRDEKWAAAVTQIYLQQNGESALQDLSEKYIQLIDSEVVGVERLETLARERGQAVKQYFVLTLGMPGDLILLNSENRCEKAKGCAATAAIFTLEE